MMKLSSSFGTNPLGVLFIIQKVRPVTKAKAARLSHLNLIRNFRLPIYLSVMLLNEALNALKNLLENPSFLPAFSAWLFFKNKAHKAGLKVNAFTAEIKIAIARVKANCL
ncbi:hypothetical protein D3C85_1088930 [compost metagenome]